MRAFSERLRAVHVAVLTLLAVFLGTTVVIMVVLAGLVVTAGGIERLWFPWLAMLYAVPVVAVLVRAGLGADLPEGAPPVPEDAWVWGLGGWTVVVPGHRPRLVARPTLSGLRDRLRAGIPRDRQELAAVVQDRRAIIYGIAVAVFITHLGMLQRFGMTHLGEDAVYVILDPFRVVLEHGLIQGLASPDFQINTYTGNPLFLLPFMLALGFTPGGLQLLVFVMFAAASAFAFLALRRLMGRDIAVVAVLVLFSMIDWLSWSYVPDYVYTVFFTMVLFYLYVCWRDEDFRPASTYLYLLAVAGGLFLMAKATAVYVLLALVAGTVYSGGWSTVKEVLTDRNIVPVVLVFLLLTAPILAWAGSHPDQLRWDLFGEVGGATAERTPVGSVMTRLSNIDTYLTPGGHPIRRMLGWAGIADTLAVNIGTGDHPVQTPTLLLLLAAGLLVLARRHVHLVVVAVTLFLLLTIIPGNMQHEHMLPLLPLLAGIIAAAIGALTARHRTVRSLVVIVIVAGLAVPVMSAALQPEDHRQVELPEWGGSAGFYADMEGLELQEPVVTNAFRVHVTARYFLSVPAAYFVAPQGMTTSDLNELPEGPGGETAVTGRFRSQVDQLFEEQDLEGPATLILHAELPCVPREEFCGAPASAILDRFNATEEDLRTVTLAGDRYGIVRGAYPLVER